MTEETTKKLCCLCLCDLEGYGANPAPLKPLKSDSSEPSLGLLGPNGSGKSSGRCCARCDDLKVMPARLVEYYGFSEATAREIGKAHWNATRTFSGMTAEEWKEYIGIRAADAESKLPKLVKDELDETEGKK